MNSIVGLGLVPTFDETSGANCITPSGKPFEQTGPATNVIAVETAITGRTKNVLLCN